jgi:2-dehydro-3-deoxygluconokinase
MKQGLVTLGETMALLRSADIGSLSHAPSMALGLGGAESNVAIGVRRLGGNATWIGVLGEDSLGDRVQRELMAEGLTLSVRRTAEAPTGLMLKESLTAQHRAVWYYRAGSAGSTLGPEDIQEKVIARAGVLHVTGITPALSASAREAVVAAVATARRHGVHVSFDVNFRGRLWSQAEAGPVLAELAASADTLFGGVEELALLLELELAELAADGGDEATQGRELAERLAQHGRTVVVKLGALGALAMEGPGSEPVRVDAVRIDPVDTVGAGDAFVAGYLAELMRGEPLEARLRLAVQTGAFACLNAGDWEGLPRRRDLALLGASEAVVR